MDNNLLQIIVFSFIFFIIMSGMALYGIMLALDIERKKTILEQSENTKEGK